MVDQLLRQLVEEEDVVLMYMGVEEADAEEEDVEEDAEEADAEEVDAEEVDVEGGE